MSAVILALLERPGSAGQVLLAARQAARLMGAARINVLAVRAPEPGTGSRPAAAGSGWQAQEPAAGLARVAALHEAYLSWASAPDAAGIATEWIALEGAVEPLVEDWGARAELIVLQRPGSRDFDRERRAVQAALFDTGRPVLVVPDTADAADFGRRIAVAWRDDMRTTRAVVAALRWLAGTAEIHVMAGAKKWETPPGLPAVFTEHGISAQLHILPMQGQKNFGEALLARAHALRADLVLLGAFAHPMLFGPVLGGVTRHMLMSADLPVLMRY